MPDAVIQQNYGEDDTESNLVTDKLDEDQRTRDIPKMSYVTMVQYGPLFSYGSGRQ